MNIDNSSNSQDNNLFSKDPPRNRKGWAEDSNKSAKRRASSSNAIELERFQDLQIINDASESEDDSFLELTTKQTQALNKTLSTYKNIDSDLFVKADYGNLDDINLSVLTKCLYSEKDTNEPDEIWQWDLLFTEISSALINEWEKY